MTTEPRVAPRIPPRVYPSTEPQLAQKDRALLDHFRGRCVQWGYVENPTTNKLERVIIRYIYPDILDLIEVVSSQLMGASNLSTEEAEREYSMIMGLIIEPKIIRYDGLGDTDALDILDLLTVWIDNMIWGRAHRGSMQKYLVELSGSHQRYTIEQDQARKKSGLGGLLNRGRG